MTYRHHDDAQDAVVDRVQDAIVAYAQPPTLASAQWSTRWRTRISREQLNGASHAWKISWIDAS